MKHRITFLVMIAILLVPTPRVKITSKQELSYGGSVSISLLQEEEKFFRYYCAPVSNFTIHNVTKWTVGDKTYYVMSVSVDSALMVATTLDYDDIITSKYTVHGHYGSFLIYERIEKWAYDFWKGWYVKSKEFGYGKYQNDLHGFEVPAFKLKLPSEESGTIRARIYLRPTLFGLRENITAENGSYSLENKYLSITNVVITGLNITEDIPSLEISGEYPQTGKMSEKVYANEGLDKSHLALDLEYGILSAEIRNNSISSSYVFPSIGTQLSLLNKTSVSTQLGEVVTSADVGLSFSLKPTVIWKTLELTYSKVYGSLEIVWYENIFGKWLAQIINKVHTEEETLKVSQDKTGTGQIHPIVAATVSKVSVLEKITINLQLIAEYRFTPITPDGHVPPPQPPSVNGSDIVIDPGIGGTIRGEVSYWETVFTPSNIIMIIVLAIIGAILIIITLKVVVPLLQRKYEIIMG